jgi:hypothetical protein
MEHERVPLSAIEVRELQRIESELAGIDATEDDSLDLLRRQLRSRLIASGGIAVFCCILMLATFTLSVPLAFAGYGALVWASVVFVESLVMLQRASDGEMSFVPPFLRKWAGDGSG